MFISYSSATDSVRWSAFLSIPTTPLCSSLSCPFFSLLSQLSLSLCIFLTSLMWSPSPLGFSTCSAVYLTAMQPAAMNSCWLGRSAAFSYWLFLSSEASFSYRSFTVCWFVRGLWAGHKKNRTQWVREGETHNKLTACMEAEKKTKQNKKNLTFT